MRTRVSSISDPLDPFLTLRTTSFRKIFVVLHWNRGRKVRGPRTLIGSHGFNLILEVFLTDTPKPLSKLFRRVSECLSVVLESISRLVVTSFCLQEPDHPVEALRTSYVGWFHSSHGRDVQPSISPVWFNLFYCFGDT